ncbi:hypothetical protein L479_02015 [Exiguobacterium sp. S17]|nr:hypothetical protein L479_02015 [Exiguobacterium sp. S17]
MEAVQMKDTVNGFILVGMVVLGMFAFYLIGEFRQGEVVEPKVMTVERSIEQEVAFNEAETLEAQLLAERAENEERKTTWFAAE